MTVHMWQYDIRMLMWGIFCRKRKRYISKYKKNYQLTIPILCGGKLANLGVRGGIGDSDGCVGFDKT